MSRNGKVIVAMSGGVDSSVAAALLKDQGYEPIGVFIRVGAHAPEPEGCALADAGHQESAASVPSAASAAGGRKRDRSVFELKNGPVPFSAPSDDAAVPPRRLKHGCCSTADAIDARAIAGRLGMPFYALNFEREFERIIDYFVDEYRSARTPNPCILCNIHVKFGKLLRYADLVDAEFIATGHYARILRSDHRDVSGAAALGEGAGVSAGVSAGAPPLSAARGGGRTRPPGNDREHYLARSRNHAKDQSYVLAGIARTVLPRCLFPLGEIEDKSQVRAIAADLGLRVHDKPDSQEICFVPDQDYKRLVREKRPEAARPGRVIDRDGNVLAEHDGVFAYTIGQRRGLGIAAGKPIYVTRLNVLDNTVTVGPRDDLRHVGLIADRVNWLVDPAMHPAGEMGAAPVRCEVKIRHMHTPAPSTLRPVSTASAEPRAEFPPAGIEARFDQPQLAVTPGQAAVFYVGDVVIAGAWIREPLPLER